MGVHIHQTIEIILPDSTTGPEKGRVSGMRRKVASAAIAGTATVASTVVSMMWQHLDQTVGMYILVGCGVVFLIAVAVFIFPEKVEAAQAGQTTNGPQSHNIGQARDVHIHHHPTPAATQERKSPYGMQRSPWDDPRFRLQDPSTWSEPSGPLIPDLPLEAVVTRLHEIFGEAGDEVEGAQDAIDQRIHEAIVDAAYQRRIDVWGRIEAGKPAKLVWREAWERGQFSVANNEVVYRSPDNPRGLFRWKGLLFNKDQIDRVWPPPFDPRSVVA